MSIKIPPGYYLQTLIDPVKGLFGEFNPELFCDRARDGTPYNSSHVLWEENGLWIGDVCRDFPGELWQIYLIGLEKPRGAWSDFQTAIDNLFLWHRQHEDYKRSHEFKSELANLKPQDIEPAHQPKKRRSTRKKSA